MRSDDRDTGNNPPPCLRRRQARQRPMPRALPASLPRSAVAPASTPSPTLFEMAEQEARGQQAKLYQRHKGKG